VDSGQVARNRDIVVIGGSAGAVLPVKTILRELPPDLGAAVFVVVHRLADRLTPHALTKLLTPSGGLVTMTACADQAIERGHIVIAPPDEQMVIENELVRLQPSPREHLFRPSIDVLFKSAAATYGRRVIGVLLSGANGLDGPPGLWQIKHRGGVTIVQDPTDAEFPGMPAAALESVAVDHVLPAVNIAATLIELVGSVGASAARRAVRILIVEDESVVATNLQEALVDMGYDVIDWVPTGEEALDLAARMDPDLILMDIHLAGKLDGIATARRIWQTQQIPIVYCTAHADLDTLKAVQTTESYGYVVKPVQSDAIRAAIELAVARREKERRF